MTTESNAISFNSVFLSKNPPADEKITRLADWGKKLHTMGMVQATEGNMSFKTRLGFIITGTDIALEALSPETVAEVTGVVYGLNKNSVYVKGAVTPSREAILHAQIYELRDDINAIFHTHDTVVMAQATRLNIPVTETEQAPGSPELAQEAVKLLKFNKGIKFFVLKNHGIISLGATMDEAGKMMDEMGEKARKK